MELASSRGRCFVLQEAIDHPDMTEDLATVLSTEMVKAEYQTETGVNGGRLLANSCCLSNSPTSQNRWHRTDRR